MIPSPGPFRRAIQRPIFIVNPPRSGSTLLFETLAQSPSVATVGGESHGLIEGPGLFHPRDTAAQSNRLTAADIEPAKIEELARRFAEALRDRDGARPGPALRLLEKTPKNSLRIPFFAAAWPDATFIYLHRTTRPTLSSMIEAWQSGRFVTYPGLPGWPGPPWSMLLVPSWRELIGRPLPEVVAHQWATTVATLLTDLAALPPDRVRTVSYEGFLAAPQDTVQHLCGALGLDWDREMKADLPGISRTTVSPPSPDKWRRHEAAIEAVWPIVAEVDARAAEFAVQRAR